MFVDMSIDSEETGVTTVTDEQQQSKPPSSKNSSDLDPQLATWQEIAEYLIEKADENFLKAARKYIEENDLFIKDPKQVTMEDLKVPKTRCIECHWCGEKIDVPIESVDPITVLTPFGEIMMLDYHGLAVEFFPRTKHLQVKRKTLYLCRECAELGHEAVKRFLEDEGRCT